MKTLADLKRDLTIGKAITLIGSDTMPNHKYMNIKRYVVKVQGNGVCLNEDKTKASGSFMDYPKATQIEYDGNTLKLFDDNGRPLTEDEKRIIDNAPSNRPENKEIVEQDILADMNRSYYMDKGYFKENNMEWYMESGHTKHHMNGSVYGEGIKGNMVLQYKIDN